MTRTWLTIGLTGAILGLAFYRAPPEGPEQEIAHALSEQVTAFDSLVGGPFVAAVRDGSGEMQLRQLFLRTRFAYKTWEWAAEYWKPVLARRMNGEPVPEADPVLQADPTAEGGVPGRFMVIPPEGLQVVETILFPRYDTARRQELVALLQRLDTVARQYLVFFDNIHLLPGQVFDAAKGEVYRVETLGITGFDAPLTMHSMSESAEALKGVSSAIRPYGGNQLALQGVFDSAAAYLRKHTDFNTFDRAFFIRQYGNPLSRGITSLEAGLKLPVVRYNRLLRQKAATLFDASAFNPDAYLPEDGRPTNDALVTLGRKLFSETALSGPGTRSCASCHRPELAFTDGMARNTVLGGHDLLARNTPTLLNAALQPALFYDMRSASLEEQIRDVLGSPGEMHGSLTDAAKKFVRDSAYRKMFAVAFGDNEVAVQTIDTMRIVSALAAYVRSLVRLNSRFDRYMRGSDSALSGEELAGFNIFMGKGRCGTCHYMPLFNGNFPPLYSRTEAEVIGVPGASGSGIVDTDEGQYGVLHAPFLRHAFKTPTVRNAAETAPYMHNGVFTTLEQVVDFYDDGGGAGEKEKVDNQTLPTDSLHLAPGEKKALISFIKALDDL